MLIISLNILSHQVKDFFQRVFIWFQDISEKEGVTAMPTFMVFKDGKKVGELVGASLEKLRALIASHCS